MAKSVLIIGGGVIGLCTAYYALQKGHKVTILERGTSQHDCCCRGNAGMIVPSHFIPLAAPGMVTLGLRMMANPESPFYIKPRLSAGLVGWAWKFFRACNADHVNRSATLLRDLSLASRQCFDELSQITANDFGLVKKGLLMLCKTEHALAEETKTAARSNQLGIPAELLTPEKTAALEPGLKMDIAGSIYFPLDCHLTPDRFLASLTKLIRASGGDFSFETQVNGWRTSSRQIDAVTTNKGEFRADEFVIAGGSWSPEVVRSLGLNLPMQAGKGYSLTLPTPRQLPQICSILVEARIAVTPMGPALRFGGTMEIAGMDDSINPARVRGIFKSIPNYFPEFHTSDFESLPVWRGFRPCSPDGLPYLGRFRKFQNLSAATGHAMMGLSLGPISGKLMAEILSGEPPTVNLDLLDPQRYC